MMIIERMGTTYRLTFAGTPITKIDVTRMRHHGRKKYTSELVITRPCHSIEVGQATAQQLFNELYEAGQITQDTISRYSQADEPPHWVAVAK